MSSLRVLESPLDTAALTDPIDRESLLAYRAELPRPLGRSRAWIVLGAVASTVSFAFLLGFWVWVIGPEDLLSGDRALAVLLVTGAAIYAVIPVLIVTTLVRQWAGGGGRKQYRLDRFARANRLHYLPVRSALAEPLVGLPFTAARAPKTSDVVTDRRSLLVGEVAFSTGSGRTTRHHRWGFASIRLGLRLPHLVLDARGNNSLVGRTNLPGDLDPEQRLSLEGDFDRHFTLSCPRGYERDALYLFSPDVMARFIDHAAQFDVEIVDDRLFLYSPRPLTTLDPATWEWLRETLHALGAKVERWSAWRDGRLGETRASGGAIIRPPHGVGRDGRRLTSTLRWWQVALGILSVGVVLWGMALNVIEFFAG